jgi:hypothetical protein
MKKPNKNGKVSGKAKSLAICRHFFPQVTRVVDAEKPELVDVTPHDADHADVKSHLTCALAIACKRFFKADGVIIALTISYIVKGKTATRFFNTGTISREITSFDRKAGFDVGLYNLVPPSPAHRFGAPRKSGRSGAHTGRGFLPKRFRHYTKGVRTSLGQIT